ncbi:MAG: hypothetical protein ACHQ01_06715 [Candidatus Limnocylindrales bacterium]
MTIDSGSQRYGRAVHHAMAELFDEFPESARPHAVEVANFWLSLGIAIGLEHGSEAQQLLGLIEANGEKMAELSHDARAFLEEALE